MKNNLLKNVYVKAFLLGLLTAFALLVPFMAVEGGFLIYAGDYNSQQIPFYMYMNKMVKSGNLGWGWATDLGSSLINSYSFYLLGSPFFWLSCLLPYKAAPYVMPVLLMLKFAVGTTGAFGYLRRYTANDNYALIGAVMYAFSGFSIYNIFFNHFIESVVFFPWLLWALDEFMYSGRKGIFPLAVAINLLNNYFFFIGQVVFLFIYFFVKLYTGEYRITGKKFLNLTAESLMGCLMGIVLFIPAAISLVENPRVDRSLSGFGLWLYKTVQQYFAIAASALLPPDPPYIPSLFTDGNIRWSSMSCFVALGGLSGFFAFRRFNRNSAFYKTTLICVICAFVPVLNSMFYAFNSAYYARWFYMPVLMLVAMNVQMFAMEKDKIFHGLKCTAVMTACLLPFGLTPVINDTDGSLFIGLAPQVAIYWMNMLIAFLSLYLVYIIASNHRYSRKYTQHLLSCCLALTVLYGVLHMGITKMPQWESDRDYKRANYDIINTTDFTSGEANTGWRMDSFNCHDNFGLFTSTPNLQFFNSTVSPSIMEFYPEVGVPRDVSSKPDASLYALRSLLSVKYIVVPTADEEKFAEESRINGYIKKQTAGMYTVYENMDYLPMGFTYERYIDYNDLEDINSVNRGNVLMRAMAVSDETAEKYNLDPLDKNLIHDYTYQTFQDDVNDRRKETCYSFNMTDTGFDCRIKLKKVNLVFFSVPYDKGFTAWVNGEKTEIEKVNYGLCAVAAPAGDNEIIFTYRTPGAYAGIALCCCGWLWYGGYIYFMNRTRRNNGKHSQ